jgi:hypothetical protein
MVPLPALLARLWLWLVCVGSAGFCVPLYAADTDSLYQSDVVVNARGDAAERNKAFTSGLEDVLVKLTGRANTPQNPAIRRRIQNTQSLVEGWAYQTRVVDGAEQLYLQIHYFQPEIQRLLDDAGIALWPANRPPTLVWLVTQSESAEPSLVDPEDASEAEVYQALQAAAARRALPLRLPFVDEQDRSELSAEQVWNMDALALRAASQRYGSESVLALRLLRTSAGTTYAKATYLFRDRVLELERRDRPESEFLDAAAALVAEALADTFAVRLSAAASDSSSVMLEVSGVRGVADYAALLRYLDGLAVVSKVQVLAATGDRLTLQLSAGGQLRQLLETLALERKLVPQGDAALTTAPDLALQYRWQTPP